MRGHQIRVDSSWTFTHIIRGRTCVFTFKHGVTEESAEGNVLEVTVALYQQFGSGLPSTSQQLATWLASMTSGVESVEVKSVIGHGAIARVISQSKLKRSIQQTGD